MVTLSDDSGTQAPARTFTSYIATVAIKNNFPSNAGIVAEWHCCIFIL